MTTPSKAERHTSRTELSAVGFVANDLDGVLLAGVCPRHWQVRRSRLPGPRAAVSPNDERPCEGDRGARSGDHGGGSETRGRVAGCWACVWCAQGGAGGRTDDQVCPGADVVLERAGGVGGMELVACADLVCAVHGREPADGRRSDDFHPGPVV